MDANFVIILVALFLIYFLVLRLYVIRALMPFSFKLLVGMTIAQFILIGLHLVPSGMPIYWRSYFHLGQGEYNPGAIFSSFQLVLTGLIAVAIAIAANPRKLWHRLYWFVLAVIFIYMAVDEYFVIHEGFDWQPLYVVVGLILGGFSALVYWVGLNRTRIRVFVMLFGGLALLTFGAIGLDRFVSRQCDELLGSICRGIPVFEEILEITGVTIVLIGFVIYAERHISANGLRQSKRLVAAGSLIWTVALLASFWVIPALEVQFLVDPVTIDYFDGDLSTLGYRVSSDVLRPGDPLNVEIYWRANEQMVENHGFSIQLLTQPQGQSVVRENKPVHTPESIYRFPRVVYRTSIDLVVPDDVPVPASYWLSFTIWTRQGKDFYMYPIWQTDRRLLVPETAVLTAIPVLPESPSSNAVPPGGERFDFEAGFSLAGYSLPENSILNQPLTFRFAWQTDRDVDGEFSQFLHLFHNNGEDVFVYDQPPFQGAFPTTDWPGGMQVVDEWELTLPDDVPPGEYRVHTGMYDPSTAERLSVSNSDGQPVQDNSIYLGNITVGD